MVIGGIPLHLNEMARQQRMIDQELKRKAIPVIQVHPRGQT